METQFLNWLKTNKSSSISRPEKYSDTINTISKELIRSGQNINLYDISDFREAIETKELYFSYNEFYNKNKRGKDMYGRALVLYIEFLTQLSIVTSSHIEEKGKIREKESIVLSRIGQGEFRDNLIKHWKACAITGFSDERFLIASHIKPWKLSDDDEKIDKYNGILLLPTFDKLFDLGFISFSDEGKILISPNLVDAELLGVNEKIVIQIKPEHNKYLQYHRENIFKA